MSWRHGALLVAVSAGRAPLTGPPVMHPMQPGCSGCIMAATDATRMHVTQPHQMQQCCTWSGRPMLPQVIAATAVAWHAECAIGPYAALQAARVHATCRMLHLMQLRALPPTSAWCAGSSAC